MRDRGRKLFTLETFTPADELDLIGFTLQYEMSYTNVLNMLDLAGLPVRRSDRLEAAARGEHMPVILAGGPCAFNPEPLADFIDVFLIGDGEELLEKVCEAYADAKAAAFDAAACAGTFVNVRLRSPYTNITKGEIAQRGKALGLDYAETWSCYKGGEHHCGKCGTCVERKEALAAAGIEDLTIYDE